MEWFKQGNTAVITGGAGGIGLETAKRFATRGMNLAIVDVKEELEEAEKSLNKIAKGASKVGLGAPALNPDAPTVTSCLPQFSYQLIDVGQLTLSLPLVALEKLCNKH